jgi:hypothetical protein
MKIILAFFVSSILFYGCATTANYEKMLDTWVGSGADQLVRSWGPPQNSYTLSDGSKVFEYVSSRNVKRGGITYTEQQPTYYSGSTSAYGSSGFGYGTFSGTSTTMVQKTTPAYNVNLFCKTIFNIDNNDTIKSWSWEGNNCKSNLPEELKEIKYSEKNIRKITLPDESFIPLISRPDSFGVRLKTLMKNDEIIITGEDAGWYSVETSEGDRGWIRKIDLNN